ncbi:copper resistance D family protein [Shewanella surugensis]|uniref:Copper resistance protein D n=1 Tax=Shewanella surugensis TaxID=212020 RepID=A0ABT0L9I6_9GAMM|nr:CopD family protein [Shewanella surugensis]MCL1124295.1 CopD family protein [Shewanella surugensis]
MMLLNTFEILAIVFKGLMYLSVAAVIGGSLMLCLTRADPAEARFIRAYIGFGAVLGLVAISLNYLALVGSFAEQGFWGMFDAQMQAFLWDSSVGEAVRWRVSGFILALVASLLCMSKITVSRGVAYGVLGLSGSLLAFSFSVIGHSTELAPWAQALIVMHLVAIASWVGSLYPLWRMCDESEPVLLTRVMHRFGQLGMAIVALVLFSGSGLLWLLFDHVAAFVDSPYGLAISVKLSLVVVLFGIAASHKWRLSPQLSQGVAARAKLKHSIGIELGIVFLILTVTGVLSSVLGPVSLQ